MELDKVMLAESKEKGSWIPVTPEKLVEETKSTDKSLSPDVVPDEKPQFPQFGGFEGTLHRKPDMERAKALAKRNKIGDILEEKTLKKPRRKMKKHRPKVFDETKPKKLTTHKVKIQKNVKHSRMTPIPPGTPKHAVSPKIDSFESCIDDAKEVHQRVVSDCIIRYTCRKRLNFSAENNLLDQNLKICQSIESDIGDNSVAQSQSYDGTNSLIVYTRRRRDDCLRSSRKFGPIFPKICKRSRMKRRKATAFSKLIIERNELLGRFRKLIPELRAICKKPRKVRQIRAPLKSLNLSTQKLSSLVSLKRKRSNMCTRRRDLSSFTVSTITVSGSFPHSLQSRDTGCGKIAACLEFQNQSMEQLTTKEFAEEINIPLDNVISCNESSQSQKVSTDLQTSGLRVGMDLRELSLEHSMVNVARIPNVLRCSMDVTRLYPLKLPIYHDSEFQPPWRDFLPCFRGRHHEQMNVLSRQENNAFTEAFVDFAVQKMESLRLEDPKNQIAIHVNDANNQIVVKNQDAVAQIVPVGKNNSNKTRKQLPKVDLDAETVRVWNLLMEKGENEQTEPEEDEKAKYWRGQREIFDGRIDSFIARMHLIQGDRRFSPWKGSVVDSVVGVYLTQNVSDHLSSSAFMNLASRFPPPLPEHYVDEAQNKNLIPEIKLIQLDESNFEESLSVDTLPSSSSSYEVMIDLEDQSKESFVNTQPIPGMKKKKVEKKPGSTIDWDELRKMYSQCRPRTARNMDSVNWEAVRQSPVYELARVIEKRGMHNILAGKIKNFLDRIVRDHGSIDLEWLRDVPPDKAKEYLLSIYGIGLKSVECVRLLTLHHHAFPVDTNVCRILVRLGWVPLQPLPGDLQIHLLNDYPMLDTVQKYIWPRICHMDQPKLYETHYQMITFAKAFCTKSKPNCNACPMRAECRHFASAFASSRLCLGSSPVEKNEPDSCGPSSQESSSRTVEPFHCIAECGNNAQQRGSISEPIIELPPSPEPEPVVIQVRDIEDYPFDCDDEMPIRTQDTLDSKDEMPTIHLNGEEFRKNLLDFVGDDVVSKDLVCVSPEFASIPMPKMKEKGRLRTVHRVYEIPDCSPILKGFAKRENDDLCPYLLAVWLTDDAADSSEKSTKAYCSSQEQHTVSETCGCSKKIIQRDDLTVKGTILIPCRTANKGSFPLNGTYFQVNEVFADHESSHNLISIPRVWIWNLNQRLLFCGTSVSAICRGFPIQEIGLCFRKGFICVRGMDRATGSPRPLSRRFHISTTMDDS